jgi:hypothetical protein
MYFSKNFGLKKYVHLGLYREIVLLLGYYKNIFTIHRIEMSIKTYMYVYNGISVLRVYNICVTFR